MAADTKIEWCDHTFNPWIGCTRVSPGCDHCYAEATMGQSWLRKATWGEPGTRAQLRVTSDAYWRQPRAWDRAAQRDGVRRRVFCASLSDVFDNDASPAWRCGLWETIEETPHLEWLLLTKRPQNIPRMLPDNWGAGWAHVRLGVSVENQEEADRRIPRLLDVPHALPPFISAEPLLGPVDLHSIHARDPESCMQCNGDGPCVDMATSRCLDRSHNPGGAAIGWVIIGGESGRHARACDVSWIRSLVHQCRAAKVACFVKQLGARPWDSTFGPGTTPAQNRIAVSDRKGGDPYDWPHDLNVREFPECPCS